MRRTDVGMTEGKGKRMRMRRMRDGADRRKRRMMMDKTDA